MTELVPTPNDCALPRRRSDFATFCEAVDYAAQSEKGLNFHDARGTLERVYPYREMREDALGHARRMIAMGIGNVPGVLMKEDYSRAGINASDTREIVARTEQFWCPIKHARKVVGSHRRYHKFVDFGDAEHYQEQRIKLRNELK